MIDVSAPLTGRAAARRPANPVLLARRVHGYIGMLIAPSLLFFAVSGGLQLFVLHEPHGRYTPPAIFETLGALHKDQILPSAERDAGPPAGAQADADALGAPPPRPPPERAVKLKTLMLKWVFLAVAVGLFTSTALGIWMALQDRLRRRLNLILLGVGIVLPLALIFV